MMKISLTAAQEAFVLWGVCFLAIILAQVTIPYYAKLVATVGFLYIPVWSMRKRDEHYSDYGVTFQHWKRDLVCLAQVSLLVFPVYVLGFIGFIEFFPLLPAKLQTLLSPFVGRGEFHFRLPDRFDERILDQLLVVALPEEFFYRGFIQQRLRDAWPQGKRFLGVRLGPAFWWTAVLFAVGHLAIFQVWRLSVFFPALIFAWMRERTGTVMSAAVFHALCNLLQAVLVASFYGQ